MSEIWSDEFICPTCGKDLEEWEEHIYECKECGIMIDVETFEVVEAEEYKHKPRIENFVRRFTTSLSDEVDMLSEVEHVYTQAAKADEYETKAKAFDVIKEYITDELRDMRRVTEDVPFAFAEELEALEDVLDKMTEYESGESDD